MLRDKIERNKKNKEKVKTRAITKKED